MRNFETKHIPGCVTFYPKNYWLYSINELTINVQLHEEQLGKNPIKIRLFEIFFYIFSGIWK